MRINNEADQSVRIINVQTEENMPSSTTLIDQISIPFAALQFIISNIVVSSYTINKAMRCLHIDRVEADTTNPSFVFVDSDNKIQMFSINFTAGSVYGQTSSQPLDYFLYSAARNYSRLAVSYQWEYWLFGVTDYVTLENERFGFKNKVGILFGTK